MKPRFSWTNEVGSILRTARDAADEKLSRTSLEDGEASGRKTRVKNHRRQRLRSIRLRGIWVIGMMPVIDLTIVGSNRVAFAT